MIKSVTFEKTTYNDLPFKFEAGTPNVAGVVGLDAALEFIDSLGYEAIHSHETELLNRASAVLGEIPGMSIVGTSDKKVPVISFNVNGIHAYDLGTLLDKQGVALRTGHHCAQPLMDRFCIPGTARISFAVYNTMDEIEIFTRALHTSIKMLM